MVKALFDTNILVDHLNAVRQARTELQRYMEKAVSIIMWMEVMVGAADDVEDATRSFLGTFDVIALDDEIAERAVSLRRPITSNCSTPLSGRPRRGTRCSWSHETAKISQPTIPASACPTDCELSHIECSARQVNPACPAS